MSSQITYVNIWEHHQTSLPSLHLPLPPSLPDRVSGPGQPSGFGFELTFRLTREKGEKSPPIWPAELMQSLSRYVFQSSNVLCVGDHVSWHSPLDRQDSSIQHMLLTQDPQLSRVDTPLGYINFIQVCGVGLSVQPVLILPCSLLPIDCRYHV